MRILTAGFETQNADEVLTAAGTYPANPVLGGYCANGTSVEVSLPNLTEFYVSFAYKMVSLLPFDRFNFWDSAGNMVASLNWGNGTTLKAYRKDGPAPVNNVLLGESTVLMQEGWNILEVHFKYASSGGTIEVRRDGTTILPAASVQTKPLSGANDLTKLHWRTAQAQNFLLDDIAINDANDGWCGYNHVIALVPNGDVSPTFARVGPVANNANFKAVDDLPANNATDYVENDTPDAAEFYDITDLTPATFKPNDVIKRVWVGARARVANTDGGNGLTLGVKSSSGEIWGSNQVLGIDWAYYRTNDITADSSGAWDQTKINALQIGMKVS